MNGNPNGKRGSGVGQKRSGMVPRLTLTPAEAAASLGVSRDFFDEHIGPGLRWIRRGRLKLVPVHELERWIERNAVAVLDDRSVA